MNPTFVRLQTLPAILRIFCLVFELVGFCCAQLSLWNSGVVVFYSVMSMIEFIATLIMLGLYLWKVDFVVQANWHKIESYFSAIGTIVFMLISSLIVERFDDHLTVAAVFGYFAMFIFMVEFYLSFKQTALRPNSAIVNDHNIS
ncbi:uncharacterized protein LOC129568621 [Sitodiplosis mosellana]|uniref:uncharacterized protein LOC129568621 n=1 Tax=Sitodiplosis mosellana TaxID=263140 RepID=UPI0024444967|nr:uncharacterized protein LOC129568621 [Sitodiplosis mosellana]